MPIRPQGGHLVSSTSGYIFDPSPNDLPQILCTVKRVQRFLSLSDQSFSEFCLASICFNVVLSDGSIGSREAFSHVIQPHYQRLELQLS